MLKKPLPVVLAAAAALVVSTAPAASAAPPDHAQRQVTVASYNLYLGGDIAPLLTAPNIIQAANALWSEVVASNFPARAEALADLLAKDKPDVVGLQEVALWEVGGAAAVTIDYLDILRSELAERGVPYDVLVQNANFGTPFPIPLSATAAVEYVDRDVVLVRAGLPASQLQVLGTGGGTFSAHIPFTITLPVPPYSVNLEVIRGWSFADLSIHGTTYRFVNTHLEAFNPPSPMPSVRNLQAQELAANLAASPHPVVLVGDLNDDPLQGGGALEILSDGLGLADAWTQPAKRGFTSGQDLSATTAQFDRRIDFVLYEADKALSPSASHAHLVGEVPADRTSSVPRLWPSDHAGVVATLHVATP